MRRRTLLKLAGTLVVGGTRAMAQQTFTFRMGHVLAPTEPIHLTALEMAKRIESQTRGRVRIQVFPSSQLGSNRDTYEQVRIGAPVIANIDPGYISDYTSKDVGILAGPFLFESINELNRVLDSELAKGWLDGLRRSNLRCLSLGWYFGERHVFSKRAYAKPQDLRGVKIRVPPNPIFVETFKTLGATPVTLEFAELYSALQQGVVDAGEAPLSTIFASKLYEVAPVITLTGHFKQPIGWMMNEQLFQSLPADIQQVMLEEFRIYGLRATSATIQAGTRVRRNLEALGIRMVGVDKKAYSDAIKPFYQNYPGWSANLESRVRAIAQGR